MVTWATTSRTRHPSHSDGVSHRSAGSASSMFASAMYVAATSGCRSWSFMVVVSERARASFTPTVFDDRYGENSSERRPVQQVAAQERKLGLSDLFVTVEERCVVPSGYSDELGARRSL